MTSSTIWSGALLGGAGVEGGLGVVLDAQLDGLGDLGADLLADQVQGHVDPGGDAGGGDDLAVLDEAAADRVGAEVAQRLEVEPVAGDALALEQAGGAEHERAGADRGRPLGLAVDLAQPGEHGLVLHQGAVADAAGDEDDVGRGDVRDGAVGANAEAAAVGPHLADA